MNATFQKIVQSRLLAHLLLALFFGYFCVDMQLDTLILEHPSGIHQWRQTDGASLAKIYYQDDNSLFHPKIHNQLGDDGSAGGEFPIIYYTASKAYQLFGPHDFIIRIIHFTIFLVGFFFFAHALMGFLKFPIVVVFPMILAVSTPTLMYYAVNFLPDGAGWGLGIAGMAGYLLYIQHRRAWFLVVSSILFAFAGLIKVSMLIPFCAILGIETILLIWPRWETSFSWKQIAWYASIVVLPVLAWYLYITHYNDLHNSPYFATGIRPSWSLDDLGFDRTVRKILTAWQSLILPTWMQYLTMIAAFISIIFRKHIPAKLLLVIAVSTLGVLLYFMLFFANLYDHDYYFIPIYFPILFLISSAFIALDRAIHGTILRIAVFGIAVICSWQSASASVKLNKTSYQGWFQDYSLKASIYDIEPFLEQHGIGYDKKVFVPLDVSSNQTLYFINRKGWTQLTGVYNNDPLDLIIDQGAEYAIVLDTSFYSITFLPYHITDTIGYHEEIGVYKIGHSPWWKGRPDPE